jgi:HEAT repeat protein
MALFKRRKLVIALAALALLGGIAWWQRTPLLAWYYLRQLAAAAEAERDTWARRVADLDTAAVPRLLSLLADGDEHVCVNVEAALAALVDRWGADDARTLALVDEVRNRFSQWNVPAQHAALRVPMIVLRSSAGPAPPALSLAAGHILGDAAASAERTLLPRTLALAAALVDRVHPGQWQDTCRDLALRSLKDAEPAQRVLAVNLALKIARRSDAAMLAKVVPLLRDAAAEARRAAMLALGTSRQVIADDDLLPFLHDADAEVRRLCELALRSRGLQENHIILAKLISHQDPAARLQVIDHLKLAPELEPGVWLRRMTEDSNRAVRAAAIRAACRDFPVDLRERIRQMALSDDSETVRNIARTQLEAFAKKVKERE